MPSWRDAASIDAQADIDGLLDFAIGLAKYSLGKRGEFGPFAATIDVKGGQHHAMALPAETDGVVDSMELIATLVDGLQLEREGLKAAAIVYDVRLRQGGGDAVAMDIEHRDGHAFCAFLPYGK